MKERISRFLLKSLIRKTPSLLIRAECQILINLMADSCGVPSERIFFQSPEKALESYARFSVKCMNENRADPEKLYETAFRAGTKIAKLSALSSERDRQQLIFLLYRNIHITMRGSLPGDITVPQCYFASYYTPKQCRMMSNVDAGIIAGIMGKGRLTFHQRLSEGCQACKASFIKEETYGK